MTLDRDELNRLEERISSWIDTGIGAARYDGDPGGRGSSDFTHPERGAAKAVDLARRKERDWRESDRVSAQATLDLQALQRSVAAGDRDGVARLSAAYPSITAGQATIPGVSPCPASQCVSHWAAGLSVKAVVKPKRRRCRRCHDFHTAHREDYPPLVLRAVSDLGGPSGPLGSKVWDHDLVLRAWDSSGWIAKPTPIKRSA